MKRPRRMMCTMRVAAAAGSWRLLLLLLLFVVVGTLTAPFGVVAAATSPGPLSGSQSWRFMAVPWDRQRLRRHRTTTTTTTSSRSNRNNFWNLWALPTSRRSLTVPWRCCPTLAPTPAPLFGIVPSAHASTAVSTKGDFPDNDDDDEFSFAQLGPLGKIVAGTVEIILATAMEYISGYVGGYALGTVTGLPAFLTKPVQGTPSQQQHFWNQVQQRAGRMHHKSAKWAGSWAGISAAFGGFRVTTKVLRGGKEDEWSTIFSSMAAGAWFARKGGWWFLLSFARSV